MTATDVIDGGVATLKVSPRAVLGITAVLVIPAQILSALLLRERLLGSGAAGQLRTLLRLMFTSSLDTTLPEAADYWLLALQSVELVLVTAAITVLLLSWYEGKPISARDALGSAVRRAPLLLAAWVMVHVLEAVATLALVIPGVLVMTLFIPVTSVMAVEGLGPLQAMTRSAALVRTRYSSVLGIGLLIGMVDLVVALALAGLDFVFQSFDWAWVLDQVLVGVASLVTTAFVAAATTLLYIDLRVRSEGLDIELGIAEHMHAS